MAKAVLAGDRSYKVNTVRALIGPQKQRITEDIRQPLFLAAARRHWFAHAWLQDDVAHELQTVYLQVRPLCQSSLAVIDVSVSCADALLSCLMLCCIQTRLMAGLSCVLL